MNVYQKILEKKPYLAWYVKDKNNLSQESAFEHILNFGDWEAYLEVERAIGINTAADLFKKIISKKRVNLRRQTVNYFENYYKKYA